MATAFRSSQSVTNGTAGTSVTVAKPAGIVDTGTNLARDHLVAFVATVGTPTITAPAGWTLIVSVAASTSVTIAAYRKLASSEGASWTWTLGSSQRNWGWVGAYTGVDPDDPVSGSAIGDALTSSTILAALSPTLPAILGHSEGIGAAAAVRAASGVATTWTHTGTERADLSTNAGAGTDIAGVVGDTTYSADVASFYEPVMTASQAQTAGVAISVTLNPYFVPYDGGRLGVLVEAAFGADPNGDESAWTWTDITSLVLLPTSRPGVTIKPGRPNGTTTADATTMTLTLKNLNGEWTNPIGLYADQFVRSLPIRVKIGGFGATTSGHPFDRGTAFLASAKPRWDASLKFAVVDIVCRGRLWRLRQNSEALHSAAYRTLTGIGTFGVRPIAYWPFEDESGALRAATAVSGADTADVIGLSFGGNSSFPGAARAAAFTATSAIYATVPTYTATGQWSVVFGYMVPTEPAATTPLVIIRTSGTAWTWQVDLIPGTSAIQLQVFDTNSAQILVTSVAVDETLFYGHPVGYALTCTRSGADIAYDLSFEFGNSGTGMTGTLAGYSPGNVLAIQTVYADGLAGAGFGHLAVYADPSIDPTLLASDYADAVISAHAGEWPWARFQRLTREEGIPSTHTQSTNTDLTMGPQGVNSLATLLSECEIVENNVLHDAGFFGALGGRLAFPAREERDNRAVDIILDLDSGQVAPNFEPTLDDQGIVNDVELTRTGGTRVRVVDTASVAFAGPFKQSLTVNTQTDQYLPDLAGVRINEGSDPGFRFPVVGWNLRKSPELAQDWLACGVGSKLRLINPPSQYPPDDVLAFIEGYTEEIGTYTWKVQANLSPAAGNHVIVQANDAADAGTWLGRLAGDPDAAIRAAITTSATSILVDPNRCRFTTVADDFNPNITFRLGGEEITVSSIATTAATFVAAGVAAHADNASVSPALPAGVAAGDLLLVWAAVRSSGTGTLTTPTGYTRLPVFQATENCQLYAKVHSGSESAPAVAPSGGAAGDTVSAQMAAFRGTPVTLTDLTDIVVETAALLNGSTQNIAYPPLSPRYQEGCVVLTLGWKQDDWTSVATLSGQTEIGEATSVLGNDQGLVWDYVIQTTPALITAGSFVVTGGASAISRSATVALAAGYQTFTVSARHTNDVIKAHAAATRIEVDDAGVLGM